MATAPPNNLFDERAPSVPLRQRQFVAVQPFFRVLVRRGAGVQTAKCQECHGDSGTTDDAGEGKGRSGRVVFVQRELGRLNSKCGSAQLGHAQCFGHALWSRSVPASALSPVLLGGSAWHCKGWFAFVPWVWIGAKKGWDKNVPHLPLLRPLTLT